MTFEKFKEIIDQMVSSSRNLTAACDLGIDLLDFTEGYSKIIHLLWEDVLTDAGFEWLEWFLYEKEYIQDGIGRSDISAHYKVHNDLTGEDEDVEIVRDLKELYEYLTQNNYFKCESQK